MKRFFSGGRLLLFATSLVLISSIGSLAHAATVENALIYDPSSDNVTKLSKAADDSKEDGWSDTKVLAKGGFFATGAGFAFDSFVDNYGYQYTYSFYCVGGTPQIGQPTGGGGYYKIKVAVVLDASKQFNTRQWYRHDNNNGAGDDTYRSMLVGVSKFADRTENAVANDQKLSYNKGMGTYPGDSAGTTTVKDKGNKNEIKNVPNSCLTPYDELNASSNMVNPQHPTTSAAVKADWANIDQLVAAGAGGGTGGATDPDASGSTSETGTNCQGGALGWLFCPMVNAMASAVQTAANFIDSLMQVRFLANKDSSIEIEKAWRSFLSLANILLVIAFLMIIFSQATSMGLSNYNIKRMLPRLVVAAILMNLSFYICAFAIDISNIVGGSIMGFLVGSNSSVGGAITQATGGEGGMFIVGAIATGAAIIALAFFIFVPVVLSIMLVFITLVGRQVILMCLVLVSPLAFVAWLLPNTEKYFKKWYELFFQMLVLYPMVMLVFGASIYLARLMGAPDGGLTLFDVGGGNPTP